MNIASLLILSDMNRCFFFTACYVFLSWSLTPGRSLINPIAFNEQLINIHIPWQIFDDVLLTFAYVIGLSSSLAIKYWWVCNTADCCCQKCNSVAMTFCVAVTGRQIRSFTVQTLTWCQLPKPHRQRRNYVQKQQRGEREFFKCFWSE